MLSKKNIILELMPKVRTETLFIHLFYILISIIISVYLIGFKSLNPFNLDWLLTNDQVGELIRQPEQHPK